MAANNESLSNVSGLCNQGTTRNDSSSSSMYTCTQQDSNSSDPNDRIIDLNERNLAMSSIHIEPQSFVGCRGDHLKSDTIKSKIMNNVDMNTEFDTTTNLCPTAQELNQQVIQDYVLQNYLYNDYKSFADDTKSMTSIMTSVSTRKTFDFLSKVLPALVFLLIVFLMIHFILYVRDIEPYNQLTEIICIALACVVFTLSSAFIVKIFCDSKHAGAQWTNPYPDDYLYARNFNNNSSNYVYSNGLLEPACGLPQPPPLPINQQPVQSNSSVKKTGLTTGLVGKIPETDKQMHYYIDAIGNRIYATQLANLDNKSKRYTRIDNAQINQRGQLSPLNQPSTNQHRRNSSFSQRSFNARPADRKSNQFEQCIQTINLNGDKKESLIKETST